MRRLNPQSGRRGSESVESVVALPLMLLVIFGGFEYGWVVLKTVQIEHAARVGARVAALSGTNASQVTSAVQTALEGSGVTNATVTLDPAEPGAAAAGTAIEVRVEAPYASNRLLGLSRMMPLPTTLSGSASMIREPDA
jgi:Flp pilus assembly protein TadG